MSGLNIGFEHLTSCSLATWILGGVLPSLTSSTLQQLLLNYHNGNFKYLDKWPPLQPF